MSEPQFTFNQEKVQFSCEGNWSILAIDNLFQHFEQRRKPSTTKITISGEELTSFDSAGALTLWHCVNTLKEQDNAIEFIGFNDKQLELYKLVEKNRDALAYSPPPPRREYFLSFLGKETVYKFMQINGVLNLIGDLSTKIMTALSQWRRSIVSTIHATGVTALPIIALLSFLIGVVLAYQMGLQLETYGANIYIAFLSGMAIFREFAPLITAIIIAGRTSSSFTAEIGSMKINEEIDALDTMGLSPTEYLVVPKVIGLLLIFPLLIFWSDFFSIIGAMFMSKFMLDVSYVDFLNRLQDSVGLRQMMLGLYKAPTFAILIALVGCLQGFRVKANAESLGAQTTKSVVQALFLIIIADAIYSIIYSWLEV